MEQFFPFYSEKCQVSLFFLLSSVATNDYLWLLASCEDVKFTPQKIEQAQTRIFPILCDHL